MSVSEPRPTRRELSKNLVFQFHRLVLTANATVANYSSELGLHGKDGSALLQIWQAEISGHPLSPSELAKNLHVTRSAVSYLTDRLVDMEYVTRETDPDDRRRTVLRISKSGGVHGHSLADPLDEYVGRVFVNRSDTEVEIFTEMLTELTDSFAHDHHRKQQQQKICLSDTTMEN